MNHQTSNTHEREYQCEDRVASTTDKIEVVGSNMSMLCQKAMSSAIQCVNLISTFKVYKDIEIKELPKHMHPHTDIDIDTRSKATCTVVP